jgi:hypothetical protein
MVIVTPLRYLMTLYIMRSAKRRRIAARWCQMLVALEEVGVEPHHNKGSSPLVGQVLVVGKEVAVTMGLGCHLSRR